MTVSYGIATVNVRGMLVKERDAILDYFGVVHTAYSEISSQVREAEAKGAKRGVMHIDSPGGQVVTDLLDAMRAISGSSIEWKVVAGDLLASAAYMLASQAKGGIYATSELSLVGSIGVAATVYTSSYKKEIANTDSQDKRPDVATEEGLAAVQRELDDIYGVLLDQMATGRGVSADTIRNDYGKGAVMTARTAKKKGIIDGFETQSKRGNKPAEKTQAAINGGNKMDLNELKKEHPAVYQAAVAEGVEQGKSMERKRCASHAEFAKRSGLHKEAIEDIASGAEADTMAMFKHLDASSRAAGVDARQTEAVPTVGVSTNLDGDGDNKSDELAKFKAAHPKWEVEVR